MLYPLQEPQSILILSGQKHLHKAYHGHVLLMLKQKGDTFIYSCFGTGVEITLITIPASIHHHDHQRSPSETDRWTLEGVFSCQRAHRRVQPSELP